jgi:hypothetical protein
MGQPVAVTEKPTSRPGLVRFELNRSLTGMGHERYTSLDDAQGPKPAAVLARRLIETGQVDAVHVFSNVVTVDVRKGFSADGLRKIVEDLYIYYTPGFVPPVFEEPAAEEPTEEAAAPAAGGPGADAALSEAAKKIPPHLLERSRAALARLKGSG